MKTLVCGAIIALLSIMIQIGGAAQKAEEKPFFDSGTVRHPAVEGEVNAYPVIARTASGKLITAWSVSGPRNSDGRIAVSTSADGGRTWSEPITAIDTPGQFDGDPSLIIDGQRIMVIPSTVVPPNKINKSEVWVTVSEDDGRSWSTAKKIETGYKYFVGKRHIGLKLKDGTLVMPASYDIWAERGIPAKTEGEMDLKAGVLLSKDGGATWSPHIDLHLFVPKVTPFSTGGVVEPAIVELANGDLYMLLRTGTEFLYESRSSDGGTTWSDPVPSKLHGHNTPASLWRLDKGQNEIIAIWNNSPRNRYPLSVAISADGGRSWSKPKDVARSEGLQISYPGIAQDADGNFVAVWQEQLPNGGGRAIRSARFNRAWVLEAK
ncbi:MAG: sialidase family protein [Pyrinomonadaceae bacterium]